MTPDETALAERVLAAARAKSIMIATAESCTGGLIAAALTEIPGSSDVVDRGFITYSYPSKTDLLGVPQSALDTHGAVSAAVAAAMAEGALSRSAADLAIAVTGVAGPGASEAKPEGLVWFAIARTGHQTHTEKKEFGAIGRGNVRTATVQYALQLALWAIN